MNMNEMTHRITDAIRRITDRLTHRTELARRIWTAG
jgi:hypothetical protein